MCFSAPSAPAVAAAPPPPQAAVQPAAAAVRASTAAQSAQQYGSTLLTGGLGDPVSSQTLGVKTLLGQ